MSREPCKLERRLPAEEHESEHIVDIIRRVHAGEKHVPSEIASRVAEHIGDEPLSKREIEALRHVAEGGREIARRLFISEDTVKLHMSHIVEKLGVKDRTHALAIPV